MLEELEKDNEDGLEEIYKKYNTFDLNLESGETLLTKSIKCFSNKITKLIIDKAGVDIINSKNESPLLVAVKKQNWEIFIYLINNEADINLVYDKKHTIMDYIYEKKLFNNFFEELMLRDGLFKNPQISLQHAISIENISAIVYVLQKGAQLLIVIENLDLFKTLAQQPGMFSYLLFRYLKLNKHDILFLLEYLKEFNDICKLLQNYLPDFIINERSNFMNALLEENEEKIQNYITIDFNYHHQDINGKPFLEYIIDKRRYDILDFLLQKGLQFPPDDISPLKYCFKAFSEDPDESLVLIAQLLYAANCSLGTSDEQNSLISYGSIKCPTLLKMLLNTKLARDIFKNPHDFITLEELHLRSTIKIEWGDNKCFGYSIFSLKKYLRCQNFFTKIEGNTTFLFKVPPCFYITGGSAFLILSSLKRNYKAEIFKINEKTKDPIYQLSSST